VNAVTSLQQDKAVRHVLEGLEVFAPQLAEDLADDLFALTFHLIGLVRFVVELLPDRHFDQTLDLILQGQERLISHLCLSNRPTSSRGMLSRRLFLDIHFNFVNGNKSCVNGFWNFLITTRKYGIITNGQRTFSVFYTSRRTRPIQKNVRKF
jgi:hypothetical protein